MRHTDEGFVHVNNYVHIQLRHSIADQKYFN
jgi:hypothetical protein